MENTSGSVDQGNKDNVINEFGASVEGAEVVNENPLGAKWSGVDISVVVWRKEIQKEQRKEGKTDVSTGGTSDDANTSNGTGSTSSSGGGTSSNTSSGGAIKFDATYAISGPEVEKNLENAMEIQVTDGQEELTIDEQEQEQDERGGIGE